MLTPTDLVRWRNRVSRVTKVLMNQQKFSQKPSFLHRRYAIRLGRRYVLSAASVVMVGFSVAGYSKPDPANSLLIQSSFFTQQQTREQ